MRRFVPGLVFRFGSSACLSPGGRGAVCRATVSSRGLLSSLNGKATAAAVLVWLWESRTRMGGAVPVSAALPLSPTPPAADDDLAVRLTVVRLAPALAACSARPRPPASPLPSILTGTPPSPDFKFPSTAGSLLRSLSSLSAPMPRWSPWLVSPSSPVSAPSLRVPPSALSPPGSPPPGRMTPLRVGP